MRHLYTSNVSSRKTQLSCTHNDGHNGPLLLRREDELVEGVAPGGRVVSGGNRGNSLQCGPV